MYVLTKELDIKSQYYKQILLVLQSAGGLARLVGGAVRDAYLNKTNYDIDIATDLLPAQIITLLSQSNIKVIPTGLKFGTVTALFSDEKFEITTLRKDLDCDGRYTRVAFTDNFMEDAARRDFTINALSYCPFEHKIYDYFNGIEDLQRSKVVFIGQAYERIQEDFLRILRFFRFSCYYAKQLDTQGLQACTQLKHKLKILSKERIKWELDKLIISDNVPSILQQMFDNGILSIILPVEYFDQKILAEAIRIAKDLGELKLCTRYSLLLYHRVKLQLSNLVDWKFSKQESKKIESIVNFINIAQDNVTELMLKKIWLENMDYIQYIISSIVYGKLNFSQTTKFIHKYTLLPRPKFPLTGYDLLKRNIQSKNIGNYLNYLKQCWLESDFILNKYQLIELLEQYNNEV